jgi:uncharacterized protein
MIAPAAKLLPDGKRLHLQHGPIDLIIEANGSPAEIRTAYAAAQARFQTVLEELVSELPRLRLEITEHAIAIDGVIATRMVKAVAPYWRERITPMAAVAGAVADEILRSMTAVAVLSRAYVNNGGDIAIHLAEGEAFTIASPSGAITISSHSKVRGIATSGWRGRSFSFGIADAVTVLARTASIADAGATIIANHVDLPFSQKVQRRPAQELWPDSDLGMRLVTTSVADLEAHEADQALATGLECAERLLSLDLIDAASLNLCKRTRLSNAQLWLHWRDFNDQAA